MSVASMSQLIRHAEGRLLYRCTKCAGDASLGEPASGSVLLRVLHLYALVGTGGHAPTPLHMRPVRLVVAAPPAEWAWGLSDVTCVLAGGQSAAKPKQGWDSDGQHWCYDGAESTAIWCAARPYCGAMSSPAPGHTPVPDSAQSLSAPAQPVAASSSGDGQAGPVVAPAQPVAASSSGDPDEKYRDQLLGAWNLRSRAIECALTKDDLLKRSGSEPLRDLLEQPRAAQLKEVENCQEAFKVIAQLCSEAGVHVNG